MSITTADQTDYVSRLTEYAKDDLAYMRAEYDQAHWGLSEPGDAEFLGWFAMMARANPDWVLSLPLDDGKEGARILRRYEQLTGLATQANIPGVTPPMGVM